MLLSRYGKFTIVKLKSSLLSLGIIDEMNHSVELRLVGRLIM